MEREGFCLVHQVTGSPLLDLSEQFLIGYLHEGIQPLYVASLVPWVVPKTMKKNKHVFLCTVYLDLFFPHYGRILLNHNINVFIKDTTQWIPVSIKDEDNLSLTFFLIKWEIYKDEIHFYFFSGCWTIIICNILYPIFLVHFSFPI